MNRTSAMARRAAIALIACSVPGSGAVAQVFGGIDTLEGFQVLP